MVITDTNRIKVLDDVDGRSVIQFHPATHNDVGVYKAVASNRVAKTVARCRVVIAVIPDAPDAPDAVAVSDTEVLLRWKQPRSDGNSQVICYSLEQKEHGKAEKLKLKKALVDEQPSPQEEDKAKMLFGNRHAVSKMHLAHGIRA